MSPLWNIKLTQWIQAKGGWNVQLTRHLNWHYLFGTSITLPFSWYSLVSPANCAVVYHKLYLKLFLPHTFKNKDVKTKELQWYGHVQRMEEGRLPKEVLEWRPSGRRKRGRPKLTWAEGIRGMMGEKGLKEEDWADRNNWRRKIAWLRNGRRKMWKHWTTC